MKRFFKPTSKSEKPTPFPVEIGNPPPHQSFNDPSRGAYSDRNSSSGGLSSTGSTGGGGNNNGGGYVVGRRENPKPQQGVTPYYPDVGREQEQEDQDAAGRRVQRRTSLKADGKLFGVGWGKPKDKEAGRRSHDVGSREVKEDDQWTVLPAVNEQTQGRSPGYNTEGGAYLPPGAMPANEPVSIIPDYPPTGPLPPRRPKRDPPQQQGAVPSPQSYSKNYGPPQPPHAALNQPPPPPNDKSHSPTSLTQLSMPPAAVFAQQPRQRTSSGAHKPEGWSPSSSEQESHLSHQAAQQQNYGKRSGGMLPPTSTVAGPRGYPSVPEMTNTPATPAQEMPAPIYGRSPQPESNFKSNNPFSQPRSAPMPPPPVPATYASSPPPNVTPMHNAFISSNGRVGAGSPGVPTSPSSGNSTIRPSMEAERERFLNSGGQQGYTRSASPLGYNNVPDSYNGVGGGGGNVGAVHPMMGDGKGHEHKLKKDKDTKSIGNFFGLGGGKDKDKARSNPHDSGEYLGPIVNGGGGLSPDPNQQQQPNLLRHPSPQQRAMSPNGGNYNQPYNNVELSRREEKERIRRDRELEKEDTVGNAINQLCRRAVAQDFADILTLLERVGLSPEQITKDCVKAVRKEIKSSDNDASKVVAAKIWLMGCTNNGGKNGFRGKLISIEYLVCHNIDIGPLTLIALACDKKFCVTVAEVLAPGSDKVLCGAATRERIKDTLAHLNYEYGRDKGLEHLRTAWMKVKSQNDPPEGYPLPPTHPAFSAEDPLLISLSPNRHLVSRQQNARPTRGLHSFSIPDESAELMRLIRECTTAKEHARVLHEALVHTRPEELADKPLIREFYINCVHDQESLVSQMGWASAQAERSRNDRGLSSPDNSVDHSQRNSHPLTGEDVPLAERAFAELLAANAEVAEAVKMRDDLEEMAQSEQEMRLVQERSKVETRIDRSQMQYSGLMPPSGLAEGDAGGSRSPSPRPIPLNDDSQSYHTTSSSLPRPSFMNDRPRSVDLSTDSGHRYQGGMTISRNTTPDSQMDNQPPRFPLQPRTGSPTRLAHKIQGPRPLADSLRKGQNNSAASLRHGLAARLAGAASNPVPTGKQFINVHLTDALGDLSLSDSDDGHSSAPLQPSSKALGKRPMMPVSDNSFDPNDMWNNAEPPQSREDTSSSDEDFDPSVVRKPVNYAYDAVVERRAAVQNNKMLGIPNRPAIVRGPGGGSAASVDIEEELSRREPIRVESPMPNNDTTESVATPRIGQGGTDSHPVSGNDLSSSPPAETQVRRRSSTRWKPWAKN